MNKFDGFVWKSKSKGYMTFAISLDWFGNHFVPDAEVVCMENNLDFRVILFMDNAPGYARLLDGRLPNVKVVFFPRSTTSKIQPTDQEVIVNTKLIFCQDIHDL